MAYNNGFPMNYQPAYQMPQQPIPQPQINTGITWVQGEAGAKAFPVAPNNTVDLWDSEEQVIYLKSADMSGMPSMKILDYTIRDQVGHKNTITEEPKIDLSSFVTYDEFNDRLDSLAKKLDSLANRPKQPVVLNTTICCPKGYVYHRPESGIVTLRGIVNNPTSCFARYQVTFNGNIAIPDGGTVGPIAVALAIDGEPLLTSRAIVTPAATATDPPTTDNFFNVTSTAIITVPKGCCWNVSVENVTEPATPADPASPILVQNANMTVQRIA